MQLLLMQLREVQTQRERGDSSSADVGVLSSAPTSHSTDVNVLQIACELDVMVAFLSAMGRTHSQRQFNAQAVLTRTTQVYTSVGPTEQSIQQQQ